MDSGQQQDFAEYMEKNISGEKLDELKSEIDGDWVTKAFICRR